MGDKLQRRTNNFLSRDIGQYSLTIGVTGVVLWAVGVPFFAIFFLGAFAFFLLKIFTSESRSETRGIFEFYLQASEILRGDGRQWFGFELRNAIGAGEKIVKELPDAPPLVRFTLGALYHKIADYDSAVSHLEAALGDDNNREANIIEASPALVDYVRILRKIEREPAESPRTAAAVRSLQRIRRSRGKAMLTDCRERPSEDRLTPKSLNDGGDPKTRTVFYQDDEPSSKGSPSFRDPSSPGHRNGPAETEHHDTRFHGDRKTISEVLQDIYDDKVQ